MLLGEFERKLKKLNKNLMVLPSLDESLPCGLYLNFYDEPIHICGVDRGWLDERTRTDPKGHIIHGGWRRAVSILISKRLIDKYQAQRLFQTSFKERECRHIDIEKDATYRAMQEITRRRMEKEGGAIKDEYGNMVPVYRREDFMNWREVMQASRR